MWGAPKSKEGRVRHQGAVAELRCAKQPCICFLFLLAPPPRSTSSSGPLLGETHKAFLPKREDLF